MTMRPALAALACVLTLACSSGKTSSDAAASTAPDGAAGSARDSASAGNDGAGTGEPSDASPPACAAASANCPVLKAVATRIVLPTSATDLALDLDGDGHPDNQYGRILGVLALQGMDVQAAQDAWPSGEAVLVDESSVDPTFANDPGAALAHLRRGLAPGDGGIGLDAGGLGAGGFILDPTVAPAAYPGTIAGGIFSSPAPASITQPPVLSLPLALLAAAPVSLPLYAAHLTIRTSGGQPVSAQINGAWRISDIHDLAIPALAASLTATIAAAPSSASAQQIKQLFDVGDGGGGACANPDGSRGIAGDGVIAACELAGNSLISSLFAPDVQLFDASGAYHPTPGGLAKDALSVGIALNLGVARF